MNRKQFLDDPEVAEFVTWLAGFAGRVPVELNIGRSGRVPQGVVKTVHGLDGVIDTYVWRADWTDDRGSSVKSLCWDSTARSLKRLGETLRAALASESDEAAMRACHAIFEWGGERNISVGARPFLEAKRASGQLVTYLKAARDAFRLSSGRLDQLGAIEDVNSMLTKVYALASDDGLPIYDSRVAAAMASLVELFRIKTRRAWRQVPARLLFPTMDASARRKLIGLHTGALMSKGASMYYTQADMPARWASAKLRLGWIAEDLLRQAPQLLSAQPHSRLHAFEASLFMIGYDVRCLAGNLNGTQAIDAK
ncbi:hypothetical protein [Paraburkholderia domus]|jgi:hypothetical protein|uniref:hypothetical protein n=1 Tax=Paraburkholderia domus TaxID=2793075 RepID=UPI001912061B|nr:hypothetical protein [Paraburkholderia domus]MBK5065648.1 hypothetical protein [Burkholderia sp. R-70199]CAE6961266.1 hypothetical protein R70199_07341 [Paraburkholderia domus]